MLRKTLPGSIRERWLPHTVLVAGDHLRKKGKARWQRLRRSHFGPSARPFRTERTGRDRCMMP